MQAKEQSISDQLAAMGYGHRRDDTTENDGKRVVFNVESGKIVGRFDAFEAIRFLKARPSVRNSWLNIS